VYLLDTNFVSAVMRSPTGEPAQRLEARSSEATVLNPIILGELRYGLDRRPNARLERRLDGMLARTPVLPLKEEVGTVYGRLRAALEGAGTPIGFNDLWIAAHALTLGATLVTGNEREFRRVPGLTVENWLAE
jgi:tRNA(fMet)-specific endonuclease VapC